MIRFLTLGRVIHWDQQVYKYTKGPCSLFGCCVATLSPMYVYIGIFVAYFIAFGHLDACRDSRISLTANVALSVHDMVP
jgi:hypothetical protein